MAAWSCSSGAGCPAGGVGVVVLTGFAAQAQADSDPRDDTDGRASVVCIPHTPDNERYGAETAYMAWLNNYIGSCE